MRTIVWTEKFPVKGPGTKGLLSPEENKSKEREIKPKQIFIFL